MEQSFKKTVILTIAIFALSFGLQAQTWYIMGEYIWSPPNPQGTFEVTHYQGEDVDIAGMLYHTVYEEGNGALLGAYRTEDNQVFYCRWTGSEYESEYLLYDYDLEEGDFFNDMDDHPMQVESVSFIADENGMLRKRIDFSFIGLEDEHEYWIEGIGSNKGFVNACNYTPTNEGAIFHLLCYHVGENLVYVDPDYNQCDIDDIDDLDLNGDLYLYPNPANTFVAVSNGADMAIEKVEIVDLLGRTVLSTDAVDAINVSTLPEGQYFVKLVGTSTVVRKLSIFK